MPVGYALQTFGFTDPSNAGLLAIFGFDYLLDQTFLILPGDNAQEFGTIPPGYDYSFASESANPEIELVIRDSVPDSIAISRNIRVERIGPTGTPDFVVVGVGEVSTILVTAGRYTVYVDRVVAGGTLNSDSSAYVFGVAFETTPRSGPAPLLTSHSSTGVLGA